MKFKGLDWLQDELDSYAGYETPYGDTSVKYVVKTVNEDHWISTCKIYRYELPLNDHHGKQLADLYTSKMVAVTINDCLNVEFNPKLKILTGLIPILSHFININKLNTDYKNFKHRAIKTVRLESSLGLSSRIRLDKNKLWEMY